MRGRKGFFLMQSFAMRRSSGISRHAMRMPQNPIRWVLTILFLTLVGLTLWIAWAMNKLESQKGPEDRSSSNTESITDHPPSAPPPFLKPAGQ